MVLRQKACHLFSNFLQLWHSCDRYSGNPLKILFGNVFQHIGLSFPRAIRTHDWVVMKQGNREECHTHIVVTKLCCWIFMILWWGKRVCRNWEELRIKSISYTQKTNCAVNSTISKNKIYEDFKSAQFQKHLHGQKLQTFKTSVKRPFITYV